MNCGIKKTKLDLGLVVSARAATAAATFTKNTAKAWPVLWSEEIIDRKSHWAIIANSGNANCFNGSVGRRAVLETVKGLSAELEIPPPSILVSSTGVIGKALPVKNIVEAIPALVKSLSRDGGNKAALAILTTDTCTKEIAFSFPVEGREVRIGAIAKGAGMMNPNMATMLCFISTDADISKPLLKKALRESVSETFNQVNVDTDMSTNDTVFILANGMARNRKIVKEDRSYRVFLSHLKRVCRYLAKELIKDGEGVTHVCEIKIRGARTEAEAGKIARQIASSMLFKTMLAGEDPNWGRVVAAVGATEIPFEPKKLDIGFEGIKILQRGRVLKMNLPVVRKALKRKEISLEVNLNLGRGQARFLTTDLTKAYVRINSWYTT
jgi:glutamate N-acetyltransferase/amino-acid N-acetyltransferase